MLKLRKRHKNNIFIKIIYIIIIGLLCTFLLITFLSKKVNPTLLNYAEKEVRKLGILVINKAVNVATGNSNYDDLYEVIRNNDNEITLITYNTTNVNKELNEITNQVQKYLILLEEGNLEQIDDALGNTKKYNQEKYEKGIIYEIPLGVIFNSTLISNIGPKIPIKISLIGDVNSYIETTLKEYGINNSVIEVSVKIEVNTKIYLPFVSKDILVSNVVPLSIKVIPGKIPYYYMEGYTNSSNLFKVPIG